jgi:hypothetical protein
MSMVLTNFNILLKCYCIWGPTESLIGSDSDSGSDCDSDFQLNPIYRVVIYKSRAQNSHIHKLKRMSQ